MISIFFFSICNYVCEWLPGLYDEELAEDGFPYPTLSYTNGPGGILEQESYETTGKRRNLTDIDTGTS